MLAAERIGSIGWSVQEPENRQERRLAAPGRTGDCDVLTRIDLEMHVSQRMRLHFVSVKDLFDAFHPNQGFHRVLRVVAVKSKAKGQYPKSRKVKSSRGPCGLWPLVSDFVDLV